MPLRARIAERFGQSGPTVSQTVARMQRDGLLTVEGDRHLELSSHGRAMATRVMRKHRLSECLLVEVIGVPWEDVHAEACRWEHVMSESRFERRLLEILGHPTNSPFGNPIPGLDELGESAGETSSTTPTTLIALLNSRSQDQLRANRATHRGTVADKQRVDVQPAPQRSAPLARPTVKVSKSPEASSSAVPVNTPKSMTRPPR